MGIHFICQKHFFQFIQLSQTLQIQIISFSVSTDLMSKPVIFKQFSFA